VSRAALAAALGAALLGAAGPAAAQSPRWGTFELQLSGYTPNIDAEFAGARTPWRTAFGDGRGWMFRVEVAKTLFREFGSIDVGFGAGYYEQYGKGLLPDGTRSGDSTAFKVMPTRLFATYRFDWLAERYGIPFAPYARLAFERYNWWVNAGSGNTASFNGASGYGATNGWSFGGGLALMLDVFDTGLAREMDRDTGINHTYLFLEFTKSNVKNFGSSSSWDLSDAKSATMAGGILFVF